MKYRKKPIVIDAIQWLILPQDNLPDVKPLINFGASNQCEECKNILGIHGKIKTLEGFHVVCPGDYIITGIKGEKYPCKPDIFEMTYEKVEE